MTKLLQIETVADMLNVSNQRAYALAREGVIPIVRIGRQIRVDENKLLEWIEKGGKSFTGGWRKE